MQQNDLLDSVLTLGSMVRRGLTETGSRSPSEATPNVRTARAPSETAPTPPTGAQALQECELVFVPRSCQATRSRHLFSIAHATVVFIILPVPERGLTMKSATLKEPPPLPPAVLGREVESEELVWNQENRHASARRVEKHQDCLRADVNLLSSSKRQLMQHIQSCHLSVVCETPLHQSGRFQK